MSLRPTLDFLLYDWLQAGGLNQRERFADHSRETFDAVLDTCERIAREKYAPFNRTVDVQEPRTEQQPDGSLPDFLARPSMGVLAPGLRQGTEISTAPPAAS